MDYTQAISDAALRNNVDPALAIEVAIAESGMNPGAVSSAGAIGIMQLMPATAAQYGVDPAEPLENIEGGTAYLGDLLNQFGGNEVAALAAYNWGPTNVQNAMQRWGQNWLAHAPGETQAYVGRILGNVSTQYQASGPLPAPGSASLPLPQVPLPLPNVDMPGLATILPTAVADTGTLWKGLAVAFGVAVFIYALS